MCFFNSQSKRALDIAKRYGRMMDAVEMAKVVIEEQQQVQKAFLHADSLIVTKSENLMWAKWGLIPFWVRDVARAENIRNSTANAKAETVRNLPSFREAIKRRRCIIPSTGYFEYHYEGTEAIPYKVFLRDTDVFALAGLYEEWKNTETKMVVRTFAVLTVTANEVCRFIHNGGRNPGRMPVILPEKDIENWLNPELKDKDVDQLLQPFDSGAMDYEVLDKDYLRRA